MRVVVVGGGIAGLAAARRLETLADAEVVLVERERELGGKLRTEHVGGFVIEAAPDSFLSTARKPSSSRSTSERIVSPAAVAVPRGGARLRSTRRDRPSRRASHRSASPERSLSSEEAIFVETSPGA